MVFRLFTLFGAVLFAGMNCCLAEDGPAKGDKSSAGNQRLHQFQRVQLSGIYYSEGAAFGDLNRDGKADIVHGPYWFAGPDFKVRRGIYPARAQPRQRYADSFFSWVHDFNGDGWGDVLAVGFPGTPAFVYENPGQQTLEKHWAKHEVFDWVSNESPHFTNLVGDDRPELVCTRDGYFGYATVDWGKPFAKWTFHNISAQIAPKRFGHGLGVGDVNGDARLDVITKDGWFAQPASLEGDPTWSFHKVPFAPAGGAEMHAYDVDGDGDNDVITSLSAHAYGLAWYEQIKTDGRIEFRQHVIMGRTPEENPYGLVFTELHSVKLFDVDGDGLKDIVTGKTYWSHHTKSPLWDAGAVVYWFKLVRTTDHVEWIPYQADGEAGIGRQVNVGDVNGDGLPDIVMGGMKGCHVLLHERVAVDEDRWKAAQPKRRRPLKAGLSPKEAAEHMTVPEGFRVTLAAGEPQVHQPIALTIDHRGRVWVAEAYTYPVRAPEGKGRDKIIILEDTNGDGRLDSRKVFCEGLNLVSGLEVGFGGVWVGAAPYLLFIPDKDGDDEPDGKPQVLLDGFGYQDTHETLNGFIWGPDGWLYGCHGVFTHSKVGKPGAPVADRVPLNAGVWRYHPTQHRFEVFAWGTSNPWGVDFNDHGQAFATACVIPHLFHVIQGGRYQRQAGRHFNPHVYDDIKTIADHVHYAGNIRDHAWWGHEPTPPVGTLAAGGGHAHCGAMIYLGDNWPDRCRNHIFMNNIHGNRVNNDLLVRRGSGFVGRHGPDLLLANDRWFRGINLRYGPDGAVYLIDWYDRNACHRRNPEIWDRTNGRIYKITYGSPEHVKVDLARLSDRELVELQMHRNDWYVRTARRLLQQRGGGADVYAQLRKMLETGKSQAAQLRALWALHVTGGLDDQLALALLDSPHEYVRGWAIQLSLEDRTPGKDFLAKLDQLAANDSSPVVRLYLASALQRLPVDQRWPLAEVLAGHAQDSGDHNLPLMYWYGIGPQVVGDAERAMKLAQSTRIPLLARFITRRAAADDKTVNVVVAHLARLDDPPRQLVVLEEMLRAFEGRVQIPMPPAWAAAYRRLTVSKDAKVRATADHVAVLLGDTQVFPKMRNLLADKQADLPARKRALEILVSGRDKEAVATILGLLAEPELQSPALRALAEHDDPRVPKAVLAVYPKLSEAGKHDAVTTLVARPHSALALLAAVRDGYVPRTDLHAYHIRQLLRFKDESLERQIRKVWGQIRETPGDKRKQIARYKSSLTPGKRHAADLSNGRRLYVKSCAACHRLFGEGDKVGPDITGSHRANLDYILENLVDPSAVLGNDYRMTVLNTKDGRVVSGLVQKETDSGLTVRTINATVVVPKTEIEQRELSKLSLMPERLLDALKPAEVRDLIAYLASPVQVPLGGPRAPIDVKTGRVPGAIEGETMKILAATAGTARSQKMDAFQAGRWSANDHLWWTGARPGARLDLEIPVAAAGSYDVALVLTKARDYGVVQLSLDGQKLGGPVDLYNYPEVVTTGVLTFAGRKLSAGRRKLSIQIVGAHSKAIKAYMFGLDYVQLTRAGKPQLR